MSDTVASKLKITQTNVLPRILIGGLAAVVVTAALFWGMQYLIETADRSLNEDEKFHMLDFVRLRRDETPQRRQTKPEKPPPPDQPPPEPPAPRLDDVSPQAEKIAVSAAPVETEIELSGAGFNIGNIGEGDYLPLSKVAPIYPPRALSRGVQGHCTVRYTVTRQGTVRDPVVVEDQCTSGMFHRASINAALKFKYKPRVVDGEAIEVPGVMNRFTYQIEE